MSSDSPSLTPVSTLDPSASTSASPVPKTHHYSDFDKDHDRRQEFRRLVDPGITRPNSREVAYEAIKVGPPVLVTGRTEGGLIICLRHWGCSPGTS